MLLQMKLPFFFASQISVKKILSSANTETI